MIQIDIEMPEKCGLCPLFHAEHPMHCQGIKADRKNKIVAPYRDPRPEWCPLNEVTADPDTVSRPKGQWIKNIDDLYPAESTLECNLCHHEQPITIDDEFCPHCGADMRRHGH